MSRAPFVLPKPDVPFPTEAKLWHTQVGWRMVNPKFPARVDGQPGRVRRGGRRRARHRPRPSRTSGRCARTSGPAAAWDAGLHDDYVMPVEARRHGQAGRVDPGRHHGREAGRAQAGLHQGRHGHRRQLLAGQRRRDRGAGRLAAGRRRARRCRCWARSWPARPSAVEPHRFSVAPVPAIRKVLDRAGLSTSDIAVWEINEAFAAMVLSCLHDVPRDRPRAGQPERRRDRDRPPAGRVRARGSSSTPAASCAAGAAATPSPPPASASARVRRWWCGSMPEAPAARARLPSGTRRRGVSTSPAPSRSRPASWPRP